MSSVFNVDDNYLAKHFSKYPVRTVIKDRPLLYQGEIPPMAFYIKSGVVKMYNITQSGEEKIVGYESSGGVIPLEWVFGRSPVSSYYYDTFTDCELYRVSKAEILEAINSDPKIALSMLDRFVSMYIGSNIHLHALEQSKARHKLLYIFQYLVLRFGKKVRGNNYEIDLRLTHQDIANLIGSTRETASSEIGKLIKDKVIVSKDPRYVIDTDKALRLLGEADFGDLKL